MKEPSKPSTVEELFTIHELRAAYWAGVNGIGFNEWHRKFQEMYPKELKPSTVIGERSLQECKD